MDFIYQKIRVMTEKLKEFMCVSREELSYSYVECPVYKENNQPPRKDEPWKSVKRERFSGIDAHYWLYISIDPVKKQDDKELRLSVKTGREGQWDACNPQFTVFIDGKTVQALDVNHTWIPLEFDRKYEIYMYLYSGMSGGNFDVEISKEIIDKKTEALFYDISVPYNCMKLLDEKSSDYINIRNYLDKATLLLDLREVYSDNYYNGIEQALLYMKEEFYGKLCGKTDGIMSCIGHTHIDVAWLWTVAQTREKAQRSFSTVLNLMRRYDDYIFMSSQPQLYKHVKESDPELYAEIKERIKEGRWEAEGAMWLEADTNLSSGESLIRQIIYGKRFMKEEFGIDCNILWLPDVFGYSGALPQILKKSGVDKFFTAKMQWSESNKLANDIFEWEGIDGSCVFATLTNNYVRRLQPDNLKETWDSFKNKSITDSAIFTFGYGDGGGGTTYEMMENYKRLKHGIPGMPKPVIKKAADHIAKVEADFYANTTEEYNRPRWVGEMYLEMHRGTYTSVAKTKKNNRKSELLYQTAETTAVADMLLCGGEYPKDTFDKNQEIILLNQFHDILPGSSIKKVYDVNDKEYAMILREGGEIVDDKLKSIKSNIKTDGGIFVYNPTPFNISDYVEVDGVTYYAKDIPAHGWKVIQDKCAENEVIVTDNSIENGVIKVVFDEKYHIVSVYDKEEKREVLPDGAEANRLEIFEDYPRAYDAWEITDYYKQKMWVADDVCEVTKLKNGIRVKRNYGKSVIWQDIILKGGSKRIDFVTKIDWHEDHVLLKAAFLVDIRNTNATYDIQFGNIQRPTHKNTSWDAAKFEVCAHKWADLSEEGYGVSILNDCKYGYSVEGNVMKISLLKAATYPYPEADRGLHEFTYSMYPHAGGFKDGGTIEQGYLLNMPLISSKISKTEGKLSDNYSLISSDKKNVVIETVKKAENDNSVIVRMYEAHNRKSNITVTAGFEFKEVYICDLLENNKIKLNHKDGVVELNIKNYEIVTLKFV